MKRYQFNGFVFDARSLALSLDGQPVSLRPKTAVLIRLLIENRQRLVDKREIFSEVWQSSHVQDQSLFQAIFEIRKALAPLQPIKTQPNLGYQWTLSVREVSGRRQTVRAGAIAASVALAALVLSMGSKDTPPDGSGAKLSAPQSLAKSPALAAFSLGLSHLENQRPVEAAHFFSIARKENPQFLEASLMYAQALLAQGQYEDAHQQASVLLASAINRNEAYLEVAAQQLMSKINEKNGEYKSALEWAIEADNNARSHGFFCAAENTRQQLQNLMSEPVSLPDQPINLLADFEESTRHDAAAPDYCLEINQPDSKSSEGTDLSFCEDEQNQVYAIRPTPWIKPPHQWA